MRNFLELGTEVFILLFSRRPLLQLLRDGDSSEVQYKVGICGVSRPEIVTSNRVEYIGNGMSCGGEFFESLYRMRSAYCGCWTIFLYNFPDGWNWNT